MRCSCAAVDAAPGPAAGRRAVCRRRRGHAARRASAPTSQWASLRASLRASLLTSVTASLLALPAAAQPLPGGQVWTVQLDHVIVRGDTLGSIGARHGIGLAQLQHDNALAAGARLRPGQVIKVNSRHLVPDDLPRPVGPWPAASATSLVVNLPQRLVHRYEDARHVAAYPAALGKPTWRTPLGPFTVMSRQQDKPWLVPPSIQAEMRAEGKPVLTRVEPGPDNPLGRHWLGLSLPGIGIHGTNAPSSVYALRSHGCIRLHPDDIAALFEAARVGTPGIIVYQPVLWMQTADGQLWLEANPDAYRLDRTTLDRWRSRLQAEGLAERIDWALVTRMWRERDGQARRVDTGRPTTG